MGKSICLIPVGRPGELQRSSLSRVAVTSAARRQCPDNAMRKLRHQANSRLVHNVESDAFQALDATAANRAIAQRPSAPSDATHRSFHRSTSRNRPSSPCPGAVSR